MSDQASNLSEDLNTQAERRMQEGDKGRKRRKKPVSPKPVSPKRPHSEVEEEEGKGGVGEGEEETEEIGQSRLKRPRQNAFFCPYKGNGCEAEGWTRARELQLHMANVHERPLYECTICNTEYNRKDNYQKHMRSQKHSKALVKKNEEQNALTGSTPDSSANLSISSTNLSSPHLSDFPVQDSFLSGPNFLSDAPSITNKEEEIIRIRATIEALQDKLTELQSD